MDRLPSGIRVAALLAAEVALALGLVRLVGLVPGAGLAPVLRLPALLVLALLAGTWFWGLREAASALLAGEPVATACRLAGRLAGAQALLALGVGLAGPEPGPGLLPVLGAAFLAAVLATLACPPGRVASW